MTTNRADRCYAVLDVGGTSIKVGAVRGTEVVTRTAVPAHARADAGTVIAQLRSAIDEATICAAEFGGAGPDGLVVAFPGPFDFDRHAPMIRGLGKFDSIHGVDLRVELSGALTPTFVRDSEAVGVGEAVFGAGSAHRRVLTCALGTGFGSCLTEDGRPSAAAGSQIIESLHRLDTPHGRADDVLSATGLARLLDIPPSQLEALLTTHPMDGSVVRGMNEFANRLGGFLTLLGFDVDLIVIAGGLAASFGLLERAVSSHLDVPVVAARLGTNGALLGAVELAFPSRSVSS